AVERLAQIGRRQWNANLTPALAVLHGHGLALQHRTKCAGITAPEADRVSLLAQVGGGRIASVPTPQYGNVHVRSSVLSPPGRCGSTASGTAGRARSPGKAMGSET